MKQHFMDYCLCKWCATPTRMLGTQECDECHELRTRIKYAKPEVLARILAAVAK